MSITATIDSRRIVKLYDTIEDVAIGDVAVTVSGVRLTFTGPNGSDFEDCPLGFAGVDVPAGATLRVSATLANGKTFTGLGLVTVTADTSNLSALILDADRIQLTAGADYTLGFQQAKIASTATSGDLGTLTSPGAITIKDIPSGSNLSTIKTDANDSIILNPGASYTLTADQAKIAKVGSAGPAGNFTGAGVITIQASDGTDLSSFTTRSTDIFVLSAGQDYSLTLAQAAIAKVGDGLAGDMTLAGNVTVKCPTADDLSLSPVKGIDILQLTTGVNYTLNASQAATAKIGAAGAMGNLLSAGVITIKADTPDIFKVVTDSNDIIILNKGTAYTLTTDQLSRTKVATTGMVGNLIEAGTIVVKANPGGEDLSPSMATGIDFIQLSPGKDYVLTAAQAVISGVERSKLGKFGDAGNITLKASLSEDLSAFARTLTDIDVIQLAAGKNYSLTVSQAKIARVDGTGTIGNLTAAGAITVYADNAGANDYTNTPSYEDLSALVLSSSDSLVLAQGGSYKLTALQASIATVGSPLKAATPPVGNLSKTSSIIIKASPLGEDISGLNAVGVTSIEISPGQKYTLTSAQAAISVLTEPYTGQRPTLTIKAQAGEDLTSTLGHSFVHTYAMGPEAIHLTAGQSYTLTAEQAITAKVGLTGEAGNLSTAGAITLIANKLTEISRITMPATASIVLSQDWAYTLTGAQALVSKVGVDGTMGNLATARVLTILAGTQSDLSSIQTGSDDIIVLNSSLNYILTSAEALRSKVGATGSFGDLKKAGVVTVKASAGEDLSRGELANVTGIDSIQLTTGADYKLTPAQLLISKFSAGAAGQVASAGVLTVVAKTSADLSLLNTDSTDLIHLSEYNSYTLTSAQAQIAKVETLNSGTPSLGNLGALDTAGTITVKASTALTGEDLSKLTVQGVDSYHLTAGVPYTLTAAQASIAKLGAAGALGNLVSTAAITINTAANTEKTDLSTLQTDSNDIILLSTVPEYQLTAGQAAIAKVVSAGVTGAAGNLIGLSKVTIDARAGGADLSKILVDSGDSFWLAPGQKYTMTTAQAATAKVVDVSASPSPEQLTSSLLGDLSRGGAIKLIASPTGNENLTNLVTDALDVIQLTDKQAYTLTAAQATIAQVGTGAFGNLVSTGTITVVASGNSDLSSVLLDKGDQIILAAGAVYTLNLLQAGIAKVGIDSTRTVGDLSGASVSVKAAANTTVAAPEDLTALATSNAVGYKLSVGQNYILTSNQAKISSVASRENADLTKAGFVTVKADATKEDLSATLANVKGVDAIQLTASADYTLTPAQLALAKFLTANATTTGVVKVHATTGADLSTLTNTDSNDFIYLSENQNYTLTTAQAKIASVVAWDQLTGNPDLSSSKTLAGSGNVIIKASSAATGEDLSELNIPGIDTYVLTAGSPYTLTAGQAAISKMGLGGSLGNLASSGVLTISATASGTNLSSIQTDANDIIQLYDGRDFTLTAAQAATAKVVTTSTSTTGTLGVLKSDGKITIDATAAGIDLSKLALDVGDLILLAPGQKYTMTTAQAAIAKVTGGVAGDLSAAGAIKLIANPLGDDLSTSLIKENPLDIIQLTDKTPYTLSASQALIAQVGNGVVGNLVSTGLITVVAGPVAPSTPMTDLTPLLMDNNDLIILTSGQNYTLSSLEARIARVSTTTTTGATTVTTIGNAGALGSVTATLKASKAGEDLSGLASSGIVNYVLSVGQNYTLAPSQLPKTKVYINAVSSVDLTKAGFVTVKADATREDLSVINPSSLIGVDAIQLTSGGTYTLTPKEALIAKVGATGRLASLAQPGVVTIDARAEPKVDLSGIGTDALDIIWLQSGNDYTLTTAQAPRVTIYAGGVGYNSSNVPNPSTLDDIFSQTTLTLKASASTTVSAPEDLTLLPNGADKIQLVSGQNYVMTSEQALIATVGATPNPTALHDLSKGGVVTIKSTNPEGEDLSRLIGKVNGVDQIQLMTGLNYQLDFSQALVAKVGASGAIGNLTSTGAITVYATRSADMTNLVLDNGDRIALTPGIAGTGNSQAIVNKYTLNATEVGIAYMDGTASLFHDKETTQIVLKANPMGEDLSVLKASAIPYIDSIILTSGQNYTLTHDEAAVSRVGSGTPKDLSKAGQITLTVSGAMPSLALPATKGIDMIGVISDSSFELFASSKLSPSNYSDFSVLIDPIASVTTGGTAGSNSVVDKAGEWKFDSVSHVLTVWDGKTVQSINLAGVNTVSVAPDATAFTYSLIGDAPSSIAGAGGNDAITGGSGNDTLVGGAGNDSITAGTGNDSISGGLGDDTVTIAGNLTAADTLAGGYGTADTLSIGTAAATSVTSANISGFEILAVTTAGLTTDLSVYATNNAITHLNEVGARGTYTVTGASATFTTLAAGTAGDTFTFSRASNTLTDSLTFVALTAATTTALTAAYEETLTLMSSSSGQAVITDISAAALTTLLITGTGGVTVTNAMTSPLLATITDSHTGTGTVTINASASTTAITFTSGAATGTTTLTTGTGNDIITAGSSILVASSGIGNDSVTGGALADTIDGGAGADSLTGGEGADRIISGGGMDTIVLTESTSVIDTIVFAETGPDNVDAVTGFVVAMDLVEVTIGAYTGSVSATISTVAGTDIGAALAGGAFNTITVAESVPTAGGTSNALFLSSKAHSTFATAIGSGSVTGATDANFTTATEGVLTVWYDATNTQAVVGVWINSSTTAVNTLNSTDTFVEIVRVGMTSTNYTLANIDAMLSAA